MKFHLIEDPKRPLPTNNHIVPDLCQIIERIAKFNIPGNAPKGVSIHRYKLDAAYRLFLTFLRTLQSRLNGKLQELVGGTQLVDWALDPSASDDGASMPIHGGQRPDDDVRGAGANGAGGVHELAFAQRQRLAAHDPADVGPAEEADHEYLGGGV